jgi:transcriptional regulator with XRE-family HTH domain
VRPTLTDARRAAGLTMTGLARRLHVSRPTVSMWEAGTRPVARHYWPAIAAALHLRPEQVSALFAGAPPARLDGVPLPSLGWARRAAGLTQRALAERVGMAPTTVSMWEVAGVRVPPWAAAELARVLGVPPARLAAGPPVPGPDPRPLRALRRSAGMTRKEAAAHLGVAVGTLDRYEAGLRTVPVTVARRMAHAYRCRLRDLPVRCGDAPLRLPRRGRWAPEDVPDGIRTLRVAAGLSRAALGRAVGRSGQAVAGWEAGRARPDEVTSRRLEEVLGLPARVLPARGQDAAAIERR